MFEITVWLYLFCAQRAIPRLEFLQSWLASLLLAAIFRIRRWRMKICGNGMSYPTLLVWMVMFWIHSHYHAISAIAITFAWGCRITGLHWTHQHLRRLKTLNHYCLLLLHRPLQMQMFERQLCCCGGCCHMDLATTYYSNSGASSARISKSYFKILKTHFNFHFLFWWKTSVYIFNGSKKMLFPMPWPTTIKYCVTYVQNLSWILQYSNSD